jgi:uncharacterized membrane protein
MILVETSLPKLFSAAALTIWPFVFITTEAAKDTALIAHENVHYKEQIKYLVVFWWIAYLLSKSFRQKAEVRAYKVQISLGGLTVDQAAYYLSTIYKLGITRDQAVKLLTE